MKRAIFAAVLAVSPAFATDALIATQGADSVRIFPKACERPEVLSRLPEDERPVFAEASATVDGKTYAACWRSLGNAILLVYEDGDRGIVPVSDFRKHVGI